MGERCVGVLLARGEVGVAEGVRRRWYVRPDLLGRSGILVGEPAVQRVRPDLGQLGLERAAYLGVGPGELEPVEDRTTVVRSTEVTSRPVTAVRVVCSDRLATGPKLDEASWVNTE